MQGVALHPEGHSLLLLIRGRLVMLPGLWGGPAIPLGEEGARYACADFTPDGRNHTDVTTLPVPHRRYACADFTHAGRAVAAVCDAEGQWGVAHLEADPSRGTRRGGAGHGRGGGRGGGGGALGALQLRGRASIGTAEIVELAASPEGAQVRPRRSPAISP